ncbi:MAG TPA: hypothetical protein VN605_02835, partial [Thermoanaerobaculia bacterium]|nr:hypothetical protein [Thermoanaerobaculia bacterium]
MKTISLIALALCISAIACHREDTDARAGWPRGVQPRVVGMAWQPCQRVPLDGKRVVPEVRCGAAAPAAQLCAVNLKTADEAAQELLLPQCTKPALAALEVLAATNSTAAVDLVAGYYVRAQRDDRPSDFLRALKTAEEALKVRPESPELRFNIALTEEALGLFSEAAISWNSYLAIDRTSEWAKEARQHLAELPAQPDESEAARRRRATEPMRAALLANDAQALEHAISDFPQTAQRYLDENVLAEWANDPSAEKLELARRMAAGLSHRSGDQFPLAEIDAIVRAAASPEKVAALRSGHRAYAAARAPHHGTPEEFEAASRDLARGGSPLRLMADVRAAGAVAPFEPVKALGRTPALTDQITRYEYLAPLYLAHSVRGSSLSALSRYLEALHAYDDALKIGTRLRDAETIAATRARQDGELNMLGDPEAAWREVFAALRLLPRVTSSSDRHVTLGQAAETALQLGHP